MSTDSDGPVKSTTDAPQKTRRLQTNVRSLVVLVACCGAVLWAWRHLAENGDPVRNEARGLQRTAISTLRSSKKQADRLAAVYELERLREGDVSITVSALIELLDDADPEVRLAALEALGTIGSDPAAAKTADASLGDAVVALARRVRDPNAPSRAAAARNMGLIGASLVESRAGGAAIGTVVNALMESLHDPEPALRSASAAALGRLDTPALASMTTPPLSHQALMEALANLCSDGDEGVRHAVMNAMAVPRVMNGPPDRALLAGLKDPSPGVRVAAVQGVTFCRQGLDPWTPPLLDLAEHDPDPSVREQCLNTLDYAFKPPAITAVVVPDLIRALKGSDAKVRSQAALMLSRFGARALAATPVLVEILNEPLAPTVDPTTGSQYKLDPASSAIQALGEIAPGSTEEKKVIAALMDIAANGPVGRRAWAAHALGRFGSAAAEAAPIVIKVMTDAVVDNKFEGFVLCARALERIASESPSADEAVAGLVTALDSKDSAIQRVAVGTLGRFGAKAAPAIPKLRALMNARKAVLVVKEDVTKALTAIGSDQSAR